MVVWDEEGVGWIKTPTQHFTAESALPPSILCVRAVSHAERCIALHIQVVTFRLDKDDNLGLSNAGCCIYVVVLPGRHPCSPKCNINEGRSIVPE